MPTTQIYLQLHGLITYQAIRIINSPNAGNTKSSLPISHRRLNAKIPGIFDKFISTFVENRKLYLQENLQKNQFLST